MIDLNVQKLLVGIIITIGFMILTSIVGFIANKIFYKRTYFLNNLRSGLTIDIVIVIILLVLVLLYGFFMAIGGLFVRG